MIQIIDKQNCCGCGACASSCPKRCIMMTEDNEGFLYPRVDEESCINCGLCEKVCNELHPYEKHEPKQVFAAINKNEEIRLKSSSGGIFYILAERIIREGGVVFGARFDERWQVVLDYAEDLKGVSAFMGSKYVQARVEDAYIDARRFLLEGRKVLFSGTPCQVAGLHKFLRRSYEKLVTVDFICHGVPSPKVWGLYLDEVINRSQVLAKVEFRNKSRGWKNFGFRLRYNDGDNTVSMLSPFWQNHYMKAFLQDITLRPSCYDCKAKGCSSLSDITIADFWGINTVFPEMDDDKGAGLVFINTDKGKAALDFTQINVAETTYERIKPLNQACYRSAKIPPKRKEFFGKLDNENIIDLIDDCTKPSSRQQMIIMSHRCKSIIQRVLRNIMGGGIIKDDNVVESNGFNIHFSGNQRIVSIRFRCKDDGWKKYNMEVRLK